MDAEDESGEGSEGGSEGGGAGAVDEQWDVGSLQKKRKMMKGLEGLMKKKERRVKSPGVCPQLLTLHWCHSPFAADVCPDLFLSPFLSLVPSLSLAGLLHAVLPLYEHVLWPHSSSSTA